MTGVEYMSVFTAVQEADSGGSHVEARLGIVITRPDMKTRAKRKRTWVSARLKSPHKQVQDPQLSTFVTRETDTCRQKIGIYFLFILLLPIL
jgi:hypothetical protein